MTVPLALLAFLDQGPAHGFALKRRYDDLLGQGQELRYGQVYATLSRLERDGLAAGVGVEPGGGADRKVYAITEAGVHELDVWLGTPAVPSGRPAELFTKVVLALVAGHDPHEMLDAQREVHVARARQLTAELAGGDEVDRLTRSFELAHLQADLQWIETAGDRVELLRDRVVPGTAS